MPTSMPTINKVIHYGRYILALSFVGFIISILISYPYAEHFIMPVQIGGHILTIVFAGIFKVSVVAIMAATKELKLQNTHSNFDINNYSKAKENLCYSPKY